ncbi:MULTISPECIES: hypothetical protein [unclassified Coleofasciculus]|uniref:hypothetical protein n=1 Tax=unclassified Coleofasciculus TaxID=2692782 RepID=UPI001880395D|nr:MULTISPECIES: hypothetical protein [unclassified Coleofasciculus]MBE9126836.1 hypothetical protein [Coleofasciculus sp. LEGE 07081]MBE9148954.1 hypothetical protein [Coleofasciculus sp. LEGE 07092]
MQSDLQGLEISSGELKHLSGVDPTEIFRPSIFQNSRTQGSFWFQEFIVSLALTPIGVGLLYVFIILPLMGVSLIAILVTLIVVPIAVVGGRWFWRQRHNNRNLGSLLDEVDRYNGVIKAIDLKDQLEVAGTTSMSLSDRQNVIEALTLIKEDLLKAIRVERILRENKTLLVSNPELLASNLRILNALQVNDQASEYGHLLNEALQIAADVSEEMKKLQDKH